MWKYKVSYSQIAKNDLKEIVLYMDNDFNSYSTAVNIFNNIKNKIEKISDNPYMYAQIPNKSKIKNVRKAVIKNYLIFYIVNDEEKEITIVRILNGKRNWIRLI